MSEQTAPSHAKRRVHAWLQLARLSNLPTVWSNTVLGLGLGYTVAARQQGVDIDGLDPRFLGRVLDQGMMLLVGMSMLYIAGMILNDACDAAIDRRQRALRPIPQGQVQRKTAFVSGAVLLALGVATSLVYTRADVFIASAVLAASILAYNVLHKRIAASFVFMGVCRMLVVWAGGLAYAGVTTPGWWLWVGLPGGVLCLYTIGITVLARSEHALLARRRVIVGLIVCMPLLDAAFATAFGLWTVAIFCAACLPATLLGQRWVSGT